MKVIRFWLVCLIASAATVSVRADWVWTRHLIPAVGTIRAAAYGNGVFVAGTSTGYLLSSRDGATWTSSRPTTLGINAMAFGNNRFVASVASGSGTKSKVLYSADGVSWGYARRVANNGIFSSQDNLGPLGTKSGRFIGIGSDREAFAASVNGTRWQDPIKGRRPANYVGSATGLTTSGNYLMCSTLAGATIQASLDGLSWTTRFMTSSRGPARGIAAEKGGHHVLCVGENGLSLRSSDSGSTWRSEPFGGTDLLGVTWANNLFLSITDKMVYSTPLGVTWTRQVKLASAADHLHAIAGGAGLYIAVGVNGRNGLVLTSTGVPGPATAQ